MLLYFCIAFFIIGCFLIVNKSKLSYLGAIVISLILSIPELYFRPIKGQDLFNYFNDLREFTSYNNFFQFFQIGKHDPVLGRNSECIIFDYIEWLVSKTSIYNLLPFFVMLIICLSLIIPSVHQRNKFHIKLHSMIMGILFIFVAFPYYNASSTLRWFLASSVFFIITYFCCENRKNDIKHILLFSIFYLSTCLIHEAMALPVIVAIFCILWTYEKEFRKYLIILFIFVILISSVKLGSKDIKLFHDYQTFQLFTSYVGLSSRIKFMSTIIGPLIYSIGTLSFLRKNKNKVPKIFVTMFFAFNLLDIVFLPTFVIAQRYIVFVAIIDVVCYLESQKNSKYEVKGYSNLYFIIPCIILGILSLMGLPYMTFNNMILSY